MPSVLFVCTANQFRSPIAAALFSRKLQDERVSQGWSVGSAGIVRRLLAWYDLILVMEKSHQESLMVEFPEMKEKIFLLTQVATGVGYDVPDPGVVKGDTFLDIATELSDLVDGGFQAICLLARQKQRP